MKDIYLMFKDASIKKFSFDISSSEPWYLTLDYKNLKVKGDDLFEALLNLRELLEQEGISVLCNGSRKDIFCSSMSKSMGGGRLGYIIKIGSPVEENTLIDIFDYADPSLVNKVQDQKDYYKRWVASLRKL